MANTIKVNNKTIGYTLTSVNHSTVKFSDGTELEMIGSVANAAVLKAYKAEKANIPPVVVLPPVIDPPIIIIPPSPGEPRLIGSKEFAVLRDVDTEVFALKPGEYNDAVDLENLKDVTILGNNKVQMTGMRRAIQLHGHIAGLILSRIAFKDISDYQIVPVGIEKVIYEPGKAGTFIDGLTIDSCTFDAGGMPFHSDGDVLGLNKHGGVIKNFQFSNNKVMNNLGSKFMVYLGNGFDFNIFGNEFTNINKQNNEDNGMFYLKASGKLHNNIAHDYQGYLARIWLHSIDGLKTVEVFNNLGYDGDKYGLIELQLPEAILKMGAMPANAKIYNNTAINLNMSNSWAGEMLTLYNTYGTVEYYYNLGAQLVGIKDNKAIRDYAVINDKSMIYEQHSKDLTKLIVSGQNIYKNTKGEAIDANYKSLFPGVGAQ